METDYSGFTTQELYDLYTKQQDPVEREKIWEQIQIKEKTDKVNIINLAGRGIRLGAFLLDAVIMAVPMLFIWGIIVAANFNQDMVSRDPERIFRHLFSIIVGMSFIMGLIGQAVFLAVNGWFLYKNGQTLGKKIVGIKIVTLNGEVPPIVNSYLLRYLVPAVIGWIPVMGSIFVLVDYLFIFRQDRRCIHDLIAKTRVVKA